MVIEEVLLGDLILVDRLHDGMVPSLDFFLFLLSCILFSLPLASPACSDVGSCGTPHLVHAIVVLIVFTA